MPIELAVPDNPQDLPPRTYLEVPIDQVAPDLRQPRQHFDEEGLRELAEDIRARGILQPITVRPAGNDRYTICYGERRWRAARMAGLTTIPCLVEREIDDDTGVARAFDQLAENLHRRDLDPVEMGAFFRRLRDEHDIPVGEIPDLCARNGLQISRSYVSNLIRLTELPDWARDLIHAGRLTAGHGKTLLMARDLPEVMEELRQALTKQDDDDDLPTVKDLHSMIYGACHRNYEQLPSWLDHHQVIEEHRETLGLFTMATPWGSGREITFVRNQPRLEELLDLIRAQEQADTQAGGGTDNDSTGKKDDTRGGDSDPWPTPSEWRRRRALLDSLAGYLSSRIAELLTPLQRRLVTLWLADGGPETPGDSPALCDWSSYDCDAKLMETLELCRPAQILAAIRTEEEFETLQQECLPRLLSGLDPDVLIRFAADLGITLEDWYITRDYLETLSQQEFDDLLLRAGFSDPGGEDCPADWPRQQRIDWALARQGAFGQPDELMAIWTEAVEAKE